MRVYRLSCLLLLFFCAIFCWNSLSAQRSAQSLQVLDSKTKQSIPEVLVFNKNKSFLAVTGDEKIDLTKLDQDSKICFQHPSYKDVCYKLSEIAEQDFVVLLEIEAIQLDEFLVRTNRIVENPREISNKIEVISSKNIQNIRPSNSGDLLEKSSQVYVQKSQAGGASPIIRGMEANKVLIVIDGVKMNNAIYRGGHLQNVLTIDPAILEKLEVIYGPGSLVYGSDALGGVMHFVTKQAEFSNNGGTKIGGQFGTNFNTVNNGLRLHFDLNIGRKKWASLTSITRSDFADMKVGKTPTKDFPEWGYQYDFILNSAELQKDSMIQNPEPHKIYNTGYEQWDLLQKFRFNIGEKKQFGVNAQYSTSSNISRNDKLNDYSGGNLKFAQWDYGPQERLLLSAYYRDQNKRKFYNQAQVQLAYQFIEESRLKRKFGSTMQSNQIEQLDIWSLNIDAEKKFTLTNSLQYGLEWTYNDVQSEAFEKDIYVAGEEREILSRYPNGKNSMNTFGLFVKDKWWLNENLVWTTGIRFNLIQLDAAYENTGFIDLPVNEFSYLNTAVNFATGLRYNLKSSQLSFNFSSGFRAPNLDDVAKYFSPLDQILVIPNSDVKPEYAYSLDLAYQFQKPDKYRFAVTGFGTYVKDLIRRAPFPIGVQDSIIYDDENHALYANTNTDNAIIFGANVELGLNIISDLEFISQISYTKGIDLNGNLPLGHIPPLYGKLALVYTKPTLNAVLDFRYNAAKRLEDYSPYNEDKDSEATADGTPAWTSLNFRINYRINTRLSLHFGAENILDQHYRTFASGISAAGRNFLFGMDLKF